MQQNQHTNKYSQTIILWLTIVIAFGFFAFFYQDSIRTIFNYWNDYGTYSHGYLTVLLSMFLVYTCIKSDRFIYTGPSIFALISIVIISLIWLIAYLSSVNTIQMLCLPIFIFFIITYFIGIKNIPVLLAPVFILLLTIPIWSMALPVLQDVAVSVTNKLLSITSLDYRVVNNEVVFSKGIFRIEESCSGLRYLLVGVLLSIVYGFLNYKSIWSTLLLMIVAIVIMLIGNFIRILTVIGLGVVKGMDYPLVQDHENLGWVLFAVLLVPLFVTARFLDPNILSSTNREKPDPKKPDSNAHRVVIATPRLLLMFIVYLLAISAAPLYANFVKNNVADMATLKPVSSELSSEWEKLVLLPIKWTPSFVFYSGKFNEQYKKAEENVALISYLYTSQIPNGELINANNTLVDKEKWSIDDSSMHQVVIDELKSNSVVVNKLTIQARKGEDCRRIWYWYEVNGMAYTKKWQVKLSEVYMNIKGNSGSAIMSISTSCNGSPDLILNEFLFDNYKQIKSLVNW